MVALAGTSVGGRYVFGGDNDGSLPYQLNLNQPVADPQNGVDRLVPPPATATRRIELSDHAFVTVDQTAQDLFDHRNADDSLATDNVFAALNSLRLALTDPADPNIEAKIAAAQKSLQSASSYLNAKQGFYGSTQNRISAAIAQIDIENLDLERQISAIRDTDIVQTALELSSAEVQSQAAMAAAAKLPRTTLFDFLG